MFKSSAFNRFHCFPKVKYMPLGIETVETIERFNFFY
jgi:hypothetical protein